MSIYNFKGWLVKFFIAIIQPCSQDVLPFLYFNRINFREIMFCEIKKPQNVACKLLIIKVAWDEHQFYIIHKTNFLVKGVYHEKKKFLTLLQLQLFCPLYPQNRASETAIRFRNSQSRKFFLFRLKKVTTTEKKTKWGMQVFHKSNAI